MRIRLTANFRLWKLQFQPCFSLYQSWKVNFSQLSISNSLRIETLSSDSKFQRKTDTLTHKHILGQTREVLLQGNWNMEQNFIKRNSTFWWSNNIFFIQPVLEISHHSLNLDSPNLYITSNVSDDSDHKIKLKKIYLRFKSYGISLFRKTFFLAKIV